MNHAQLRLRRQLRRLLHHLPHLAMKTASPLASSMNLLLQFSLSNLLTPRL
jgi:hypothetical protein